MPTVPLATIPKGGAASPSLDTTSPAREVTSQQRPEALPNTVRRAPEGMPGSLPTRTQAAIQSLPSSQRRKLRSGALGTPRPSRAPVAHSADLERALQKGGRLEDFDAKAFLAQLVGDQGKDIWPPNPAFFSKLVRSNARLQTAFSALQHALPQVEDLCRSIDKGLWGEISHKMDGKEGVDMLYFSFAAGRISALEFATALNVLNMKEQYGLEVSPRYRDKKVSDGLISLPAHQEDWKFFDLFSEDEDELTVEGREYLGVVANNLIQNSFLPRAVQPDELVRDLARHLRGVPRNLQMGMQVESSVRGTPRFKPFLKEAPGRTPADLAEANRRILQANAEAAATRKREWTDDPGLFWADQMNPSQMPFNASPDPALGPEIFRNRHLYIPSSAVMASALQIFNAQALPAFCLGRLSSRQLAELHVRGFHPVIMRDDRVGSNHTDPHGHAAGALHASMHDEFFHCMALSRYTIEQRKLCGETLFNLVDAEVDENNPVEKAFGDDVLATLADMASRDPVGKGPAYFLNSALMTAMAPYVKETNDRSIAPSAAWRNVKTCVDFQQRLWSQLGEQHPEFRAQYPEEWASSLSVLDGMKERVLDALATEYEF